jgi:hypothetical protein
MSDNIDPVVEDKIDAILHDALKKSRDNGVAMVLELFEVYAEQGLCADCVLREVKQFLATTSYTAPEPIEGRVRH